ncbi:metallophosphoesterase [Anticarsia gemmatalis]|uniref:metallophosphoesterase n=1 Tax=Anticarsia gemmatalis TaxID=129554 RepID=UPI003F772C16
MYLRRSTTVKYFIAAFLGAAVYCEWFIYLVQPQYWSELECSEHDSTCTKILFIADPQIQGNYAVPTPLNYLFNWDSDRYLKSTFSVVMKKFKPDVLVYLGDLMDEGSIAPYKDFHEYVGRLLDIFEVDYEVTQIWLPGDNDIGGENEPVRYEKLAEFEKSFQQPSVIYFRNISFYKVNGMTNKYPEGTDPDGNHTKDFKMIVSHYPLTHRRLFVLQMKDTIHPNIFFCAHTHESKYVTQSKDFTNRKTTWFNEPKGMLSLSFNEDTMYEVFVPTCSYRMGTSDIGYGAAVLENNNQHMRYTVFWSSTRFPYLILYLVILTLLLLYCLVFSAARFFHRKPKIKKPTADMSPLLERL